MAKTNTNKTEKAPEDSKTDSEEDVKETSKNTEDKKDHSSEDEKEPKKPSDDETTSEEATITEKTPPELTKDEIVRILKTFPGVGQVIAERIFDSGIDSREKLANLTVDDLKKLPGIGQSLAQNITDGIEKAISDFDEPEKKEPAAAKKEPGITTKAIGFVKGTFNKITGFFRGKQPKSKTEPTKKPEPGPAIKATEKPSPEEKASDGDLTEEQKTGEELEVEEEAVKETYFPEVGTTSDESEPPKVLQEVTIEGAENDEKLEVEVTEEPEVKPDIEPDQEPKQKLQLSPALESSAPSSTSRMEINFKNPSGLLIWFENTPNLRLEAGKLLFKAGYNNLEELKDAVVEDLTLVNGISEEEAKTIYEELRKL